MQLRTFLPLVFVIAAAACGRVPPSPPPAGSQPAVPTTADAATRQFLESLDVTIETRLVGARRETLSTRLTITNRRAVPVPLHHGDCVVDLRIYRDPARTGEPVWRASRRHHLCMDYLQLKTLAPRETYSPPQFGLHIPVARMLGDSLPPRPYYFDVEIRLLDDSRIPQGRYLFTLPAGEAHLRHD